MTADYRMGPSTFLLEVVVGELSLTPDLRHPVTSPAVCVQVRGGPPLVIPYLPPAFTSSLGHPHTHPTLFNFQRGKSCIFSAPRHLFIASKGASVKIEVLRSASDGMGVRGALIGCHDGLLVPQGESMHLVLRGKLSLVGRNRESVGDVSTSISLKCLGVEVPGGDRAAHATHTPTGLPSMYEESFSVLQDAQVPYDDLPASEKIALKIASLDPANLPAVRGGGGGWAWQDSPRVVGELAQPPPILYLGWDADGERMWQEKVAMMDQTEAKERGSGSEEDSDHQDEDSDQTPSNTTSTPPPTQPTTKHPPQTTHKNTNTPSNTTHTPHTKPRTKRRHTRKHAQPYTPSRPRGWLRSTPLAPQCTAKPPRLNRTYLLRLAAKDAHLDRDLKAEVERRVKSRVRDLEVDFLTLFEKLSKKRNYKVNHGTVGSLPPTRGELLSVGCQTDSAKGGVPGVIGSGYVSVSRHDSDTPRHTPQPQLTTTTHHSETRGTQTDATHALTHTQTLPEHANTKANKHKHRTNANINIEEIDTTHALTNTQTDKQNTKNLDLKPLPDENNAAGTESLAPRERPREAEENYGKARLLLGDIPKNLTYVIGPDGEKVYVGMEVIENGEKEREEREKTEMRDEERRGKGREETRREKNNGKQKRNEKHSRISSSSSSSSSSSPAPPVTPRPGKHPFLTAGEEHPLREPSQDTWGLTYTIHPAEQQSSTSTRKSTPPTPLSSSVDVEEEEVEEVEEVEGVEEGSVASSVSNEVFREIWKGRRADLLSAIASSPPQSVGESLLSPPTSPHSQSGGVAVDDALNATSTSSTDSNIPKSKLMSDSHTKTGGSIDGTNRSPSASARSSGSISDISARIAALLVARKIEVPRLNTDSVSSYVPSDQPGTISSMSDVLVSPSSSSSSG